jgi:hypothetical protein
LHYEGTEGPKVGGGDYATDVAEEFNYRRLSVYTPNVWLVAEVGYELENLQIPPIMSGIKYQVRFLNNWKMWKPVLRAKRTTKIMAATLEGS